MKRKTLLIVLFYIFCFCSCISGTKKDTRKVSVSEYLKDSIALQGTVPFEYDKSKKGIILDAIVNDTLHLKAIFDTGSFGAAMSGVFSKNENIKDTLTPFKLQVGRWIYKQPYTEYIKNKFFLDAHGCDLIFGGGFFTGKIIEISFEHHYIRELENTEDLGSYDKIPFKLLQGWNPVIKVKACIKGKSIEGEFVIDTGYNGTIFVGDNLIKKYKIPTRDGLENEVKGIDRNIKNVRSNADTIQVGCSYITNTIAYLKTEKQSHMSGGLIGNKFFENFSVVLDFKNNYLYLKPIEKLRK
jgi:hypothetical protein